ncbi:helix-turn-helix domain-containing protein [Anaerocolumna sedimenticola]|uniref:Helix-turn-helix domain-containing protein n=1 Tax=Anaerocolumna sedimenticola TaxID=2696063 RepID=A0A6P1TKC4_9FIRM|nr:AraC family transcriptional regulator [Anaerocolumna sedimenticola]QHQ60883.1 helix-turn-helix domain-containing protein [Anaerocolumna sedimenticola]
MKRFYFFKLLIALILFVIVPSSIITTINNYATAQFSKDIIASSEIHRLQMVSNANNLVFDSIFRDAMRLSVDTSLQSLGNNKKIDEIVKRHNDMFDLLKFETSIIDYARTNDLFYSVYFYVNGADYIISSDIGIVRINQLTDIRWIQEYKKLENGTSGNIILPSHFVKSNVISVSDKEEVKGQNCISYIYKITPYTSNLKGALVFNINEEKLRSLYTVNKGDDGFVIIINNRGEVISNAEQSNNLELLKMNLFQKIQKSKSEQGYFSLLVNGKSQLCSFYKSPNSNLIYYGANDMDVLFRNQTSVQIKLVFAAFAISLAGLFAAYYISRRLYNPIALLVKEIYANERLNLKNGSDEIQTISKVLNELLKEENRIFIDNRSNKIHEASLLRIISSVNDATDDDIMKILPFPFTACAVILPGKLQERMVIDNNEKFEYYAKIIIRICEEMLSEGMCTSGIRYHDESIALIISIDANLKNPMEILREKLNKIQLELSTMFNFPMTITVGSLQKNKDTAYKSFEQANEILHYRFIKGYNSIIFYSDVYPEAAYYYPAEDINLIETCLELCDKDKLFAATEKMFKEIAQHDHIDYNNVIQILNQLVTNLIDKIVESHLRITDIFEDKDHLYKSLWLNETLDDACNWLIEKYNAVIDYQNRVLNNDEIYFNNAIQFIKQNYKKDINIDIVAENIGISYSYLRKIFKEKTDKSLVDYINELRLNDAKNMLRNTRLTIKEISSLCGYNHERSFSRVFTQYENITPGMYRNTYKQDKKVEEVS